MCDVFACKYDLAFVRFYLLKYEPDKRGLACTAGTYQKYKIAPVDMNSCINKSHVIAVFLCYIIEYYHLKAFSLLSEFRP